MLQSWAANNEVFVDDVLFVDWAVVNSKLTTAPSVQSLRNHLSEKTAPTKKPRTITVRGFLV